jgi:hypothetical protein
MKNFKVSLENGSSSLLMCEEGISTQANFAFVYISQYLGEKEHGLFGGSKVVKKFEALNPWEKANVFFELAPHFHGLLLESAKALTERAREEG